MCRIDEWKAAFRTPFWICGPPAFRFTNAFATFIRSIQQRSFRTSTPCSLLIFLSNVKVKDLCATNVADQRCNMLLSHNLKSLIMFYLKGTWRNYTDVSALPALVARPLSNNFVNDFWIITWLSWYFGFSKTEDEHMSAKSLSGFETKRMSI